MKKLCKQDRMAHFARGLRIVAGAAALEIVVCASGPVRAAPVGQAVCEPNEQSNTCLTVNGSPDYQVHVGIDVHATRAYAEQLMACSNNPFVAELWGNDGSDDEPDFLTDLTITPGWPQVWDGGLSAEFDELVDKRLLNEDDYDGNRRDEVFVRVTLYNCNEPDSPPRIFEVGDIEHNF